MTNLNKAFSRWKEVLFITALIKIILFILSPTLSSWIRWDAPHYIDIAKNGYQLNGEAGLWIVFYPLYPLLIKLINLIFNNFNFSAIFISNFFAFIASIALYELTLLDFQKRVALLAVWFMNIFPTAYFLQSGYTESLFLATSIGSIYFYRKSSYFLSGLFGLLASATRINGLLLLPLMLFERKINRKNFLTFLITPIGFLIYLLINYKVFGDFFYFIKPLYSNWFKKLDWPWVGLATLLQNISPLTNYIYFSELIAILFISLTGFLILLKVRKSYGIYIFLNLILILSTSFILSTPRYILSLFPIYILMGKIENKVIIILLSFFSFIPLILFSLLFTKGKWA
ncbi:MAG: mannosyltransferase family protein, partial [Nanoarchaeota archaeon]